MPIFPRMSHPAFPIAGRPARAFLFDMDGVVADTRAAHGESWRVFLADEGLDTDPHEFLRWSFGRGNREIMPRLFPARDHAFYDAKGEAKETIFRRLLHEGHAPLVPGLLEFLEALADRGIPCALGSSAPQGNVDAVLAKWNLGRYFRAVVSSAHVTHAKPHPEIFLKCSELLGIPGPDCVVFEDSLPGLQSARAANCRAVGILTMHTPEELAGHCELSVPDFTGFR